MTTKLMIKLALLAMMYSAFIVAPRALFRKADKQA